VPPGYVRNVRHEPRRNPRSGLVTVEFLALITAGALPHKLGSAPACGWRTCSITSLNRSVVLIIVIAILIREAIILVIDFT
jgi:hypothetical protein